MIVRPKDIQRFQIRGSGMKNHLVLGGNGIEKPKTESISQSKLASIGGKLEKLEESIRKKNGKKTQNIRFD